jgi:hypothetical protein
MLVGNILLLLQSISAIWKNFNTFPFPAFFNFNTGFALSDGMTGFIGESECINRSCLFFLKLPTSFIRIGEGLSFDSIGRKIEYRNKKRTKFYVRQTV